MIWEFVKNQLKFLLTVVYGILIVFLPTNSWLLFGKGILI